MDEPVAPCGPIAKGQVGGKSCGIRFHGWLKMSSPITASPYYRIAIVHDKDLSSAARKMSRSWIETVMRGDTMRFIWRCDEDCDSAAG